MVIQHNLNASNASRMYNITNSSIGKSSEKLSSGYRINRAADDAAGLTISEKMRKQIRGLDKASTNASDGISMVQIADGALEEVHSMLQRSNELAVQASNGTLSDSDRISINEEILKIKDEINSITKKTKFNELNVFTEDGYMPNLKSISATAGSEGAVNTLAGKIKEEFFPNAVSQILDSFSSLGSTINSLAAPDKSPYYTTLSVDYIDGVSNKLAYMQASFSMGSPVTFSAKSLLMKVDKDDFPSVNMSEQQQTLLESTIAHETMHGVMDVAFPERMSQSNPSTSFPLWFVEGTAQLAGGGFTTGWNNILSNTVKNLSSANDTSSDSAISNYLKTKTVETNEYGHGYLAAAYASYLAADGNDVSASSIASGANKIFQSFLNDKTSSFNSVMNSAVGVSADSLVDQINNGSITTLKPGKASPTEFVRRLAYNSLGGAGSVITGDLKTGGSSILGETAVNDDQPIMINNVETSYNEVAVEGDSAANVVLQIGSDRQDENKLEIKLFNMNCDALSVGNTDVLTEKRATSAIDEFGKAIKLVSGVRSYFGAMQNRLEHTIKNLDNVVENTTSAESRIRDTDMADEMVSYSKDRILAQAGEAMLSQANANAQSVMALLQF